MSRSWIALVAFLWGALFAIPIWFPVANYYGVLWYRHWTPPTQDKSP